MEWREETWPTGNKRFRVSTLEPDSRTIIDVGCFNSVCTEGKEPAPVGPWVDVADATAHMRAGGSIALLGMGSVPRARALRTDRPGLDDEAMLSALHA